MTEKLTIQDIAHLAGVSKATVSRVLNQKPDVDPATRERILRIMQEQGFVPSITASGLANGRSRLIGVLIPSLTWPLIPEMMRGVAEVVGKTSYELVLYSINDINHEKDRSDVITRILSTQLTSGLLAIYPGQSSQYLTKLHQQGFPIVLIDDQILPPADTPWIGSDNYSGGYEATRYLLQLGHRRIAHIQGPLKYQCSHDRYNGYRDALREFGLEPDPALVLQGDFMPPSGRANAHTLFSLPERPTAIFASNDYMAYGVMATAEEYGLRIPEDISIVGFDDTYPSALMQPPLTSVRQPFFDMGQRAIKLMLSLLESPAQARGTWNQYGTTPAASVQNEPVRIQLPTNLVIRASCSASTSVIVD
ncbi:MAG TPA: LacI family DNA-binding transcriptional regulator [Ktedonobacteraceae bacterium]|nr:LacI family DNA-binding transcriptional regulator [Ktedonobacteraceae bacterium]